MADPYPAIAAREPAAVDVEEGKTYFWCACGLSKSQPFCDGSHKVTNLSPVPYTAGKTGKLFFCQCKRTGKSPLCDGSHNNL